MKKIFAFVLAMVMVATLFTACGKSNAVYDSEKDAVVEAAFADLVQIPGYDYLYYSATDRSVYYMFERHDGWDHATGFFGSYVRNGHTCEYVGGEIVEVIPTVRIEEGTN